jgi:hypothetical protein
MLEGRSPGPGNAAKQPRRRSGRHGGWELDHGFAEGSRPLQLALGHEAGREDCERRCAGRCEGQDWTHLSACLRDRLSGGRRPLCEDHLSGGISAKRRRSLREDRCQKTDSQARGTQTEARPIGAAKGGRACEAAGNIRTPMGRSITIVLQLLMACRLHASLARHRPDIGLAPERSC